MAVHFFKRRPSGFLQDIRGATAVEYGLIVALMTIVLVAGLILMGGSSTGMWGKVQTQVGGALR